MNFMGMGVPELIVIGLVAFLLFGAKGMQDGVKSVGKVVRDLKGQSNEFKKMVMDAVDEVETEVNSAIAIPPDGAVARPTGARPAETKIGAPAPAAALAATQASDPPAPSGQMAAAVGPSQAEGSKK